MHSVTGSSLTDWLPWCLLIGLLALYLGMVVRQRRRGHIWIRMRTAFWGMGILLLLLATWSIAGPDPAPHRSRFALRLGVLFASVATHGYLSKLMYAHRWPRGTHHALADIQEAARWMYYGGDLAEVLLAVALFAGWHHARRWRSGLARAVVKVV